MDRGLQIVRVDPFDPRQYDEWYGCYAAAELADRGPDAPLWTKDETRAELQQVTEQVDRRVFIAVDGGEVLAAGKLALGLKENTHRAALGVYVRPEFRRQGIGSAVLAALEQQAIDADRRTLAGESSWPYAPGPDGAEAPGREFARRHGYALAIGDVLRRLPLPVPDLHLERLAASAVEHHRDYTLQSWSGPVPEDVLAGLPRDLNDQFKQMWTDYAAPSDDRFSTTLRKLTPDEQRSAVDAVISLAMATAAADARDEAPATV